MNDDPRYAPVASALPPVLPALDRVTSVRYAKRIIKHFGRLGLGSPNQTSPASYWRLSSGGRRCWISTKPTTRDNHNKGWGRLVHDCSHIVFAARHPTHRPHAGGHATLEREIAEYVVAKGWLAEAPAKQRPDLKLARLERDKKRLVKWQARLKRAHNAVRKLGRSIARRERLHS